jgi:deoxyribodipyrimidine photo-lyase
MTPITVFWFKRDLRIHDNEALMVALSLNRPLLLVYLLEPSILRDEHTDERHIRFIKESIADLNRRLEPFGTRVLCLEEEVIDALSTIHSTHSIDTLVSTRETGLDVTFQRDRRVAAYCASAGIRWVETRYNGIRRGLRDRSPWLDHWEAYVSKTVARPDLAQATFLPESDLYRLESTLRTFSTDTPSHMMQKGGRTEAERWMDSFFGDRITRYSASVSKPGLSESGASKVSAYLAWGNLSVRELVHRAMAAKNPPKAVFTFVSRLRLQSYFIQKFESHPSTQFRPFLKEYEAFRMPKNEAHIAAWKEGRTGYPLVDACMRCLVETGYLNFRMRSLLFSFYAHHLFQHLEHIGAWLARQFLDFEPGIHYGQLQTQSGFTGSSVVRIFNPTKNAHEYDERAEFIQRWVPELRALPPSLAIEPWQLTPMEEMMYGFQVGVDYPARIVDVELTRRQTMEAHERLRSLRN